MSIVALCTTFFILHLSFDSIFSNHSNPAITFRITHHLFNSCRPSQRTPCAIIIV
jgi:hypothetical protein